MLQDNSQQGEKNVGLLASRWAKTTQQLVPHAEEHHIETIPDKNANPFKSQAHSEAADVEQTQDQKEPGQDEIARARAPSPQAVGGSPIEEKGNPITNDYRDIGHTLKPGEYEATPTYIGRRFIRYASGDLVRRDARRLSNSRSRSRNRTGRRLGGNGKEEQYLSRRHTGFLPEQADDIAEFDANRGRRREEEHVGGDDYEYGYEDEEEHIVQDEVSIDLTIEAAVERSRSFEETCFEPGAHLSRVVIRTPTRSTDSPDVDMIERSSVTTSFNNEAIADNDETSPSLVSQVAPGEDDNQRDSESSLFTSSYSCCPVNLPPPQRKLSEDSTTGMSNAIAAELIKAWRNAVGWSSKDFRKGASAGESLQNKRVDFVMQQEDDFYGQGSYGRRASEGFIQRIKDTPRYRERLELRLHEHKMTAIEAKNDLELAEGDLVAAIREADGQRCEADGQRRRVQALREQNNRLNYQVAAERERANRDSQIAMLARRRAKGELHFWQHYVDSGTQTVQPDESAGSSYGEVPDTDKGDDLSLQPLWSKIDCDMQSELPYPNPQPDAWGKRRIPRRASAPSRFRLRMVRLEKGDKDEYKNETHGGDADNGGSSDGDSDESSDSVTGTNVRLEPDIQLLHPANLVSADYERWPTHLRADTAAEIIRTATGRDVSKIVEDTEETSHRDLIVYGLLHSGKITFASLFVQLQSIGLAFDPILLAKNLIQKGLTVNPEVLFVAGEYNDPCNVKLGSLLETIIWLKQDLVDAYKETDQWSYDNGLPVRLMHFSNRTKDGNDNEARLQNTIKELKQKLFTAEKELDERKSLEVRQWADAQKVKLLRANDQGLSAQTRAQPEKSHATMLQETQRQHVDWPQFTGFTAERDDALKDIAERTKSFEETFDLRLSEYDPDMLRFFKGDSDTTKQVKDLDKKLLQSNAHIQELQAERNDLTIKVRDLSTQFNSLKGDNENLSAQLTEKDEFHRSDREDLVDKIDKLENENTELNDCIKGLEVLLTASQAMSTKANDQLAIALSERISLKTKNKTFKRDIRILEEQLRAANLSSPLSPTTPGFENAETIITSLQEGLDRHHRSAKEAEKFLEGIRSGRREPSPSPPRLYKNKLQYSPERVRQERDWERVKQIIALGRDEGTKEIWKFLQEKEARGEPPI
ncbi:hypothetical protein K431DRAFT_314187 [Polychaeton citri CBS 116435]|uniref:Uncharacterized protein n=1 Tax=Polychaeton citri CBS 116435 TaxID=1314669 RepID=A0A9P4Q7E0_9PEZI|nr:hypothetical protein K431DRAFT_314187 [Polychaeton citri CBS 116435]